MEPLASVSFATSGGSRPAGWQAQVRIDYVINKVAVPFRSIEQLTLELRRASGDMKEPVVVISADATATHQAVVRVMEAARQAGLSQITFTTQSSK